MTQMIPDVAPRIESPPAARRRALVVDDSERVRDFLQRHLAARGWDVTACEDGEGALGAARSAAYDLVLTDLGMPGMDGIALVRQLRALRENLPVIVVSAASDTTSVERAFRCGAADYLRKPFGLADLDRAILRATSRRAGAAASADPPSAAPSGSRSGALSGDLSASMSALLDEREVLAIAGLLGSETPEADSGPVRDRMHWAGVLASAVADEARLSPADGRRLRSAARLRALSPAVLRALREIGAAASIALRAKEPMPARDAAPHDSARLGALVEAVDFIADRWSKSADATSERHREELLEAEGDVDPQAARIVAEAARRVAYGTQA
ncbi:MAG: Regulator of RpoS [Planctomycetes bacterium]|nr:Regulator of RpoS [Planctomycetota bacterium]